MTVSRRLFATGLVGAALLPRPGLGQASPDLATAMMGLMSRNRQVAADAAQVLEAHGKPDIVAGLITALRFASHGRRDTVRLLETLTGETHGESWFDWMLWQEAHPEIVPHESYARFKRDLYRQIDPAFDDFLKPRFMAREAMKIRLEEIAWGGVIKDGIPSLDNPQMITATEAEYLKDDDLVFGVRVGDDARAYPLRIMGWHEMFNDVIGGVPLALAYCTLCGAGILFETDVPGLPRPACVRLFGVSLPVQQADVRPRHAFAVEPVHGRAGDGAAGRAGPQAGTAAGGHRDLG